MKRCLILLLLMILFVAFWLRWVDQAPDVPESDYAEALEKTAASSAPWVVRGSAEEEAALARFKQYWSQLTEASVRELLPSVYAENVWFNDTVKTITHRDDLMAYMVATAGHVQSCSVEVKDIATSDEGYYVRWVMHIVPKNAAPGEVWSSIGLTHLRINEDGKVILHQDYWDSAGGMYEHFPVLGWVIRNIKARL